MSDPQPPPYSFVTTTDTCSNCGVKLANAETARMVYQGQAFELDNKLKEMQIARDFADLAVERVSRERDELQVKLAPWLKCATDEQATFVNLMRGTIALGPELALKYAAAKGWKSPEAHLAELEEAADAPNKLVSKLAAATARVMELETNEEIIKQMAATILGQKFVGGDWFYVPGPVGCVEELVKRFKAGEQRVKELIASLDAGATAINHRDRALSAAIEREHVLREALNEIAHKCGGAWERATRLAQEALAATGKEYKA